MIFKTAKLVLILACLASSGCHPPARSTDSGELDVVMRGGLIADGTGAPLTQGSLGIRAGKMVLLAPQSHSSAAVTIDATGLVIAPGFIDVHNHTLIRFLVRRFRIWSILKPLLEPRGSLEWET